MIKVGLTGNIACGKSLVENMLKEKGYPVIDADKICHNLLDFDKNTIENVKKVFGNFDILQENKDILCRYKIGQIIFKEPNLKVELEKILHPQVINVIKNFFEQNKETPIAIASIPLLYETKLDYIFDRVIVVIADEDIQLARLLARNGFNQEHALARINSQLTQEHKKNKADYVINNSGDIEDTKQQLDDIILKLLTNNI